MIDVATETWKHEKKEGAFLGAIIAPMDASLIALMTSSLIQPVGSSLINAITGKGVMRAGKGQEACFLLLLVLPLMMKIMGKGITRAGKRYNNIGHMDIIF